jgi:hypothetical protein
VPGMRATSAEAGIEVQGGVLDFDAERELSDTAVPSLVDEVHHEASAYAFASRMSDDADG